MRRAAALLSTIGLTPAACAAADKQPIFRSNGAQSLSAWQISGKSPEDVFVELAGDPAVRFKSPDGSNTVNGIPHPPFITQQSWNFVKSTFTPKEADVWVATYPKCGTTFTEQIVLLLQSRGNPECTDPASQNTYSKERGTGKVWVEATLGPQTVESDRTNGIRGSISPSDFEALPSPRLLKTHAPWQLFLAATADASVATGTKVIYVSRNARDACVSAYYHAANPQSKGFPFDAWARTWAAGLFEHGSWWAHVAGWRAAWLSNPNHILWVRYEDIRANPEQEIRRIADFLEITDLSDDEFSQVVKHSGFKAMKQRAEGTRMENFYRKGTTGDWRTHFVDQQLVTEWEELDAAQTKGLADFPY